MDIDYSAFEAWNYQPPADAAPIEAAPAGDVAVADAPAAPAAPPVDNRAAELAEQFALAAGAEWGDINWAMADDPSIGRAAAAGLDAEGQDLMRSLDAVGLLDKQSSVGSPTFGNEIANRLEMGAVDNDTAKVLMRQILDPNNEIKQCNANTCVAATAQKAMALNDPSLYFVTAADIVRGGTGNLPNGDVAIVSGANQATIADADLSPQQRVDAMMQSALMDYANGADAYDVATDRTIRADGSTYPGLKQADAAKLNQAALKAPTVDGAQLFVSFQTQANMAEEALRTYGGYIDLGEYGSYQMPPPPSLADVVRNELYQATARNFPGLFVAITSDAGEAHMVMVRSADMSKDTVTYTDALGTDRTMPITQFANIIAYNVGAGNDADIGADTSRSSGQTTVSGRGSRGGGG